MALRSMILAAVAMSSVAFGRQDRGGNFHPVESLRVQLRADALNAFNRTLWGNTDTNAASPLFGQVTSESDWFSPRKIQFGVRADW